MNKKLVIILLTAILFLSAFMRLYKISDYMTFLGDEGRDVMIAKGILEGDFTLLGPRSSAGDFFYGPIYYYMITPFLWLFHLDPVGPAVMVALVSVLTTALIYLVGKKFFNTIAGLTGAALYAISRIVIEYSHSSWNPDVLPFFSLLIIYFSYISTTSRNPWKYYLLIGFLFGIALQLHYLILFLAAGIVIYIFVAERLESGWKKVPQTFMHYALLAGGFLIGFAPFLAFEVRHDFLNTKAILGFIFGDTVHKSYDQHISFISNVGDAFFRLFAKPLFIFPAISEYIRYQSSLLIIWGITAMLIAGLSIYYLFKVKNKKVILLLSLWMFLSVFFFGFYKKKIDDYHFAFLFPLPFILVGNMLAQIAAGNQKKKKHTLRILIASLIFGIMFIVNLLYMPFLYPGNRQRDQAKEISQFVISKTDNKPYNFAMISGGNSDYAYRYYLEILGHKPIQLDNQFNDPQRKTVTNQLLVVCEDPSCSPLGNPLFDVAAYGRAQIVNQWNVSVVKVVKLIHYNEPEK
jgi:4-amino-4-deoxy-L-arabinose transferase-like glycosyltransferase